MADILERKGAMALTFKTRETWLVGVETALVAIIVTSGFLGNALICTSIYKFGTLRKPQNYYILSLAASDLLIAILGVVPSFVACILGRWPFGDVACQLQGAAAYILASFSLLNLTLISIDRYIKIVKSMDIYQKIYTKGNIVLSILASGLFSSVFVIPYLSHGYCFHFGKLACMICESHDAKNKALILAPYAVLIGLTFPIIAVCYYKVFRKVRAHFSRIADSSLSDRSRSFAEEVKIAEMLFITLLAFLISWTPVFAIEFTDTIRGEYGFPREVYVMWSCVGAGATLVNPLIYGLMRKEFREAYKKVLTCKE